MGVHSSSPRSMFLVRTAQMLFLPSLTSCANHASSSAELMRYGSVAVPLPCGGTAAGMTAASMGCCARAGSSCSSDFSCSCFSCSSCLSCSCRTSCVSLSGATEYASSAHTAVGSRLVSMTRASRRDTTRFFISPSPFLYLYWYTHGNKKRAEEPDDLLPPDGTRTAYAVPA